MFRLLLSVLGLLVLLAIPATGSTAPLTQPTAATAVAPARNASPGDAVTDPLTLPVEGGRPTTRPRCALISPIRAPVTRGSAWPAPPRRDWSPTAAPPPGIDLDVTFINRAPMYRSYCVDYPNGVPGMPVLCPGTEDERRWPAAGEVVTFTAHIVNKGTLPSPPVDFKWLIDGSEVASGTLAGPAPGGEVTAAYAWPWAHTMDGERVLDDHTVRFVVDPADVVPETFEANNSLEDRTNALGFRIGITPEMVAAYNSPWLPGLSYSAEDWLQRQIAAMNWVFANSIYPLTPGGATERVRINSIEVTPTPPVNNRSSDGGWFVDADYRIVSAWYDPTTDIDWALVHELSHQVGVIDLYQLNLPVLNVKVLDRREAPGQLRLRLAAAGPDGRRRHRAAHRQPSLLQPRRGRLLFDQGLPPRLLRRVPVRHPPREHDPGAGQPGGPCGRRGGEPVPAERPDHVARRGDGGRYPGVHRDDRRRRPRPPGEPADHRRAVGYTDRARAARQPVRRRGHRRRAQPLPGQAGEGRPRGVRLARYHRLQPGVLGGRHGEPHLHREIARAAPAAPAPPQGLAAQLAAGRVTLNWNGTAIPEVIGYYVYAAAAPTYTYEKISGRVTGTSYVIDYNDSDRIYVVTAVDLDGRESGFSRTAWVPVLVTPSAVIVPEDERLILDTHVGPLIRQDGSDRYLGRLGQHFGDTGDRYLAADASGRLLVTSPERQKVSVTDPESAAALRVRERGGRARPVSGPGRRRGLGLALLRRGALHLRRAHPPAPPLRHQLHRRGRRDRNAERRRLRGGPVQWRAVCR